MSSARPDGYLPLISVLQSSGVQRAGATEALLASLPAKLSETIEAMEDGGVLYCVRSTAMRRLCEWTRSWF